MATVRAKFRVSSVNVTPQGTNVSLDAVVSGSPENDAFFAATPSGKISLGMVKPATGANFPVGAELFVDFTTI